VDLVTLVKRLGIQLGLDDYKGVEIDVGRVILYVGRVQDWTGTSWTIAHKLGHVMRHEFGTYTCAKETFCWDPVEREAESFARGLLMPRAEIRVFLEAATTLGSKYEDAVSAIMNRYNVRKGTAQFRISEVLRGKGF
jgi:Zn-dependent peptidase ImmA (M78 family)